MKYPFLSSQHRAKVSRLSFEAPKARRFVVFVVWCGLVGDNTIFGPYIFHGPVNGQSYLDMINNFVLPILATKYGRQRNGAIPRKWWFQDGAPAHRSRAVTQKLTELFQNRIVALNQVHEWPPRSRDLTPFFSCGGT